MAATKMLVKFCPHCDGKNEFYAYQVLEPKLTCSTCGQASHPHKYSQKAKTPKDAPHIAVKDKDPNEAYKEGYDAGKRHGYRKGYDEAISEMMKRLNGMRT